MALTGCKKARKWHDHIWLKKITQSTVWEMEMEGPWPATGIKVRKLFSDPRRSYCAPQCQCRENALFLSKLEDLWFIAHVLEEKFIFLSEQIHKELESHCNNKTYILYIWRLLFRTCWDMTFYIEGFTKSSLKVIGKPNNSVSIWILIYWLIY